MILVDSNIPMYLVGASHPHKLDAQRLLESALSGGERLVTDAEVLQEICHRYVAIKRREAIQPAFDAIIGVVDEVLPIERTDVEHARDALLRYQTLSARDALHRRHGSPRHYPADELRPWVRLLSGDQASGLIRNHTAAMSGTDVAGAAPGGMLSGQNGSNGIVVGRPPHPYDRCGHCVALPASEHAGCRGADRA